ncbi:hypothetical protein [Streptomyces sp. NPDC056323]|uniref:hypothetical protein n=1 Tax=Streptomyces sp. NPDC056323 TaxID=3345784 RepID=UPI0035DEFAFE
MNPTLANAASSLSGKLEALQFWKDGTFWAFLGVVVAAAGAYVTYRTAWPRRKIFYEWDVTSLFLSRLPPLTRRGHHPGPGALNGQLQVLLNGNVLENPHLVSLRLTNAGSKDITSSHFANAAPLRAQVGHPILDVLSVTVVPPIAEPPAWSVDGNELHIGPSRIGKGETLTLTFLVDGRPDLAPERSFKHSLIDVTVKERDEYWLVFAAGPQARRLRLTDEPETPGG